MARLSTTGLQFPTIYKPQSSSSLTEVFTLIRDVWHPKFGLRKYQQPNNQLGVLPEFKLLIISLISVSELTNAISQNYNENLFKRRVFWFYVLQLMVHQPMALTI